MHVLFVSPWLPSVAGGGTTRTFNLVKQVARHHRVSVLSFVQPDERRMVGELRPYCERLELIPWTGFVRRGKWSNRLRGWAGLLFSQRPRLARTYRIEQLREPVARLIDELDVDIVQVESLFAAEVGVAIRDKPAIMSTQNVEYEIVKRLRDAAGNPVHRLRDELAWRRLRAFEQRWASRYPMCLAVSAGDAAALKVMAPNAVIEVIPNGVDSLYFAPPDAGPSSGRRPKVAFVGTMNYEPNVDGALYFCHEIWPLVRRAVPDAEFTIVGARPAPSVLALKGLPGVTVTGSVDDIRPYYWNAGVSVVPLRAGGGTRFKILESLAAGCPVVSTTIGAEGLDLAPARDYSLADSPEDFAAAVIRLLRDPELSTQMAGRGQASVRALYDWNVSGKTLVDAYDMLIERVKHA